jgi:type IV fimbrial biogenesis protein FimT
MRRGLTLLELMAVLAVLAVLMTLAVPSTSGLLQRQRLNAAAEALAGDLAEARFEAARRNTALHLESHGGPAWCWSVAASPGCSCDAPTSSCRIKTVRSTDHPGIQLVQPLQARLDPADANLTGSATLASSSGESLRVDLTPMGRARICVPSTGPVAAATRYPKC